MANTDVDMKRLAELNKWSGSVVKRCEELLMSDPRKAWKWLMVKLPHINEASIEKRCGLRKGRLYDAKAGRSKMTDDELRRVNRELKRMFGKSLYS